MDVVVIGGSAAGLKAACRIARLQQDATVKVIEKSDYYGYSGCGMPYFLSGDVPEFKGLMSTSNGTLKDARYFKEVKGIDIFRSHEAISIDRSARLIQCYNHEKKHKVSFPYDKLVIATGANPITPSIPIENNELVSYFTHPTDAIKLHSELSSGKISHVTIIGAGFIGLELCEAFRALWGADVSLIEIQPHVLSGVVDNDIALLVQDELIREGIDLHLSSRCSNILQSNDQTCLSLEGGDELLTDRVIIATGFRPDTSIAEKAGINIGVTGGIKVDRHLATSDPDIYAAGDCVELKNAVDGNAGLWALGSLANRMGRIVGDNICNGDSHFGMVTGANVFKVFDLTVGTVGINATNCKEGGFETKSSWGTFYDRLHYYPEAGKIHLKLEYEENSGKIFGLQAVARGQVVHIMDKAAQAIKSGSIIDELKEIEHVYSPPFSQPFDPLHYMAFIADNSRSAGIKLIAPDDFYTINDTTVVLDVRSTSEIEETVLREHACEIIEIPVEELRSRLGEIPKDRPIITICQMGSRAWDAALMIRRAGWSEVSILAGGVHFLPRYQDRPSEVKRNELVV